MEITEQLAKHTAGQLSYQEGVALFTALYPANKTLISFFQAEDRISRAKLKAELTKAAQQHQNKQENKFQPFAPVKRAKVIVEGLPADLRHEYMKQGARIREMADLHGRLYQCSTNEQRHEIALKIVALAAERRSVFQQVDHYTATGEELSTALSAPPKILPGVPRDFAVEDQIRKLMSRRSKAKKKGKAVEAAAIDKQIQELRSKRYA